MGSYTTLAVDDYGLLTTKSYADLHVLTVFRETDKHIRVIRIDDANHARTIVDKPVPPDYEIDEEGEGIEVGYSARGSVVRDRLDVMGFTLSATRSVFDKGIAARLARLRAWAAEGSHHGLWAQDIEKLQQLSFDRWVAEFREIKARGATKWSIDPASLEYTPDRELVEVSEMGSFLIGRDGEYPFQFPGVDIRFFLRAVIEACGDDSEINQELGEVMGAGYYWYDDPVAENASAALEEDFPMNARIVVLTEGVTDRRVLEGSLKLLYPHLTDYIGFMDFEGAAIGGGAGPLVATVKAFAGAGIANRVVAFFDNDTAARAAVRGLRRVELPSSIRIEHYPPLPLARDYPTLGPSGAVSMDVNGLAGSVELYFGEDVLRGPDGELIPVVWRNYEDALGTYHGEVSGKALLQQRFDEKLAAAAKDPTLLETLDWSGMRLILSQLLGAFVNEPAIIPDD